MCCHLWRGQGHKGLCFTVIDLMIAWVGVVKSFRIVQVWDAITGTKQYTFEGHESPVYSVCPHHKENIQVNIFIC